MVCWRTGRKLYCGYFVWQCEPFRKTDFSFPQSTGHLPVYYNYLPTDKGYYKEPGTYEKPGRDYVFSNSSPLWAFGYGLSYTQFEYLKAVTDKELYQANDTVCVTVQLKNTGKRTGKEVIQVYMRDVVSSVMTPVKQLKGFRKSRFTSRTDTGNDYNDSCS